MTFLIILIYSSLLLCSGVIIGMRIKEHVMDVMEEEMIEEKPLVSKKNRRKVYRQIDWRIDN